MYTVQREGAPAGTWSWPAQHNLFWYSWVSCCIIGTIALFPVYSHYMTHNIADPYSELCSVYILKITCESGVRFCLQCLYFNALKERKFWLKPQFLAFVFYGQLRLGYPHFHSDVLKHDFLSLYSSLNTCSLCLSSMPPFLCTEREKVRVEATDPCFCLLRPIMYGISSLP